MSVLTDSQKKFLEGKTWKLSMHLNCEDKGVLEHRCEDLKINRLVVTPKVNGHWGTGNASYFRDGDETEYATIPELLKAMGVE